MDPKFQRRNVEMGSYAKPNRPFEPFKSSHARFDIYSEVKSNHTEGVSKQSAPSTAKTDEATGNRSESDHYESVGETLSDGIKSMKMFPVLSSYQEINSTNR